MLWINKCPKTSSNVRHAIVGQAGYVLLEHRPKNFLLSDDPLFDDKNVWWTNWALSLDWPCCTGISEFVCLRVYGVLFFELTIAPHKKSVSCNASRDKQRLYRVTITASWWLIISDLWDVESSLSCDKTFYVCQQANRWTHLLSWNFFKGCLMPSPFRGTEILTTCCFFTATCIY